jgi:hypothetical protein
LQRGTETAAESVVETRGRGGAEVGGGEVRVGGGVGRWGDDAHRLEGERLASCNELVRDGKWEDR